jgi:hypothetical protein
MIPITYVHMLISVTIEKARVFSFVCASRRNRIGGKGQIKGYLTGVKFLLLLGIACFGRHVA